MKKKKKKKKKANRERKNQKKKKPTCWRWSPTWGVFLELISWASSSQFSPHFGEKAFWWARGENTWTPPFIFLPPHPTKHTQKKFQFPIFSPKFSIHPISSLNKHTLRVIVRVWFSTKGVCVCVIGDHTSSWDDKK